MGNKLSCCWPGRGTDDIIFADSAGPEAIRSPSDATLTRRPRRAKSSSTYAREIGSSRNNPPLVEATVVHTPSKGKVSLSPSATQTQDQEENVLTSPNIAPGKSKKKDGSKRLKREDNYESSDNDDDSNSADTSTSATSTRQRKQPSSKPTFQGREVSDYKPAHSLFKELCEDNNKYTTVGGLTLHSAAFEKYLKWSDQNADQNEYVRKANAYDEVQQMWDVADAYAEEEGLEPFEWGGFDFRGLLRYHATTLIVEHFCPTDKNELHSKGILAGHGLAGPMNYTQRIIEHGMSTTATMAYNVPATAALPLWYGTTAMVNICPFMFKATAASDKKHPQHKHYVELRKRLGDLPARWIVRIINELLPNIRAVIIVGKEAWEYFKEHDNMIHHSMLVQDNYLPHPSTCSKGGLYDDAKKYLWVYSKAFSQAHHVDNPLYRYNELQLDLIIWRVYPKWRDEKRWKENLGKAMIKEDAKRKEEKRGLYDPSFLPVAKDDITFKSGKTVKAGEKVANQGQAQVMEKKGWFAPATDGGAGNKNNESYRKNKLSKATDLVTVRNFKCPPSHEVQIDREAYEKMGKDGIRNQLWCTVCQAARSNWILEEDYKTILGKAEWVQCQLCWKNGKDNRRMIVSPGQQLRCRKGGYSGCGANLKTNWKRSEAPVPPVENC